MRGSRRPGANRRGLRGFGVRRAASNATLAEQILAAGGAAVQRLHLSPVSGSGLAIADCYSLVDGGAETWLDLSGNARHYTQAVSTKRPTYSATAINSRPGLTVDGGDVMVTASYALTTFSSIARICLFQDSNTDVRVVAERSTNAGSTAGGFHFTVNESAGAVRFLANGGGTLSIVDSTARDMSTPTVVTGTNDQTLATNETEIRFNGTNATNNRPNNGNTSGGYGTHAAHIGGRGTTPTLGISGAYGADIELAWAGTLGATELAIVAEIESLIIAAHGVS